MKLRTYTCNDYFISYSDVTDATFAILKTTGLFVVEKTPFNRTNTDYANAPVAQKSW